MDATELPQQSFSLIEDDCNYGNCIEVFLSSFLFLVSHDSGNITILGHKCFLKPTSC